MSDQADTLRRLMRDRAPAEAVPRSLTQSGSKTSSMIWNQARAPRVFTVASGKGGVGKSCITANLGAALARQGLRVMMVDADVGLANLDILLDVHTQATLEQVMSGEARLQDAIVGVEPNLWLVPSASGIVHLRSGTDAGTRRRLAELLGQCPWEMDVILVDCGAGIQRNVLSMHDPNFESLVVVTPEPTSMTDAYGLMKLLRTESGVSRVSVIVNQVTDLREARAVFQKLKDVADRFFPPEWDFRIEFLGHLERDEKITQSVLKRKILLDLDAGARSIPSLDVLAKRVGAVCADRSKRNASDSLVHSQAAGLVAGLSEGSVGPDTSDRSDLSGTLVGAGEGLSGNTAGFWRTLLQVPLSDPIWQASPGQA